MRNIHVRASYRYCYYLLCMIITISKYNGDAEIDAEVQASLEYAYQQLGRTLFDEKV